MLLKKKCLRVREWGCSLIFCHIFQTTYVLTQKLKYLKLCLSAPSRIFLLLHISCKLLSPFASLNTLPVYTERNVLAQKNTIKNVEVIFHPSLTLCSKNHHKNVIFIFHPSPALCSTKNHHKKCQIYFPPLPALCSKKHHKNVKFIFHPSPALC